MKLFQSIPNGACKYLAVFAVPWQEWVVGAFCSAAKELLGMSELYKPPWCNVSGMAAVCVSLERKVGLQRHREFFKSG